MTDLELKFLLIRHFNGFTWCYLELDAVEWTMPQYCHQN